MLKFPIIGRWLPGQISVSWTSNSRKIIPQVESQIEAAWKLAAAKPDIQLFDGPIARLESFREESDLLHLTLSRSSFKILLGTNLSNSQLGDEFGNDVLANAVGVSVALISSDGYFLMGRRNDRVAYYPSRVHPFAGSLEPRENLDVFEEAFRELHEELALSREDISEIVCFGLAEDVSIRQPELVFAATSNRTRAEIESTLDDAEHRSIWACRADRAGIESALQSDEVFTPVAIAAMLLWGKTSISENWFVQNAPLFQLA